MPIGYKHTEETKAKLRETRKRQVFSEETRKKWSEQRKGRVAWNKGKTTPDEVKKKMSIARKGRPVSLETRMKLSEALMGHKDNGKTEDGLRRIGEFGKTQTKEKNSGWKGGKFKNHKGYVFVLCKNHPYCVNGYVLEHRLVMEVAIGRYLKPKEVVHHINGICGDNTPENLMLFACNGEHLKYHAKEKRHRALI